MRPSLLLAALLLPLASRAGSSSSSVSNEDGRQEARPHARQLILRLSDLEAQATPAAEVRVAGGVSTIITTPWALSARGTGVGGRGERPFEVLLGARRVVVTPTRPLLPGERFPLVLRFVDGTALPLVLVAAPAERGPDQVVALSFDDDDKNDLRLQLAVATARVDGLAERLRQALREQDSEDFALAGLLAGGYLKLTALENVAERQLPDLEGWRVRLETFSGHGSSKVAIRLTITNASAAPLQFAAGHVFNGATLQPVPSAWRAHPAVIGPGAVGYLAVVLERAAFGPDGADKVVLDVRPAAAPQLHLELGVEEFDRRWPF